GDLAVLNSFPTRRSSDLAADPIGFQHVFHRMEGIIAVFLDADLPHRMNYEHFFAGCGFKHAPPFPRRAGRQVDWPQQALFLLDIDRKSTRLNSSHVKISY